MLIDFADIDQSMRYSFAPQALVQMNGAKFWTTKHEIREKDG